MNEHETVYCGRRHRTSDGVPIAHRCRVLAPAFLRAEAEEAWDEAVDALVAMPLVLHPGVPSDATGGGSPAR
jgi:hypothetical protein